MKKKYLCVLICLLFVFGSVSAKSVCENLHLDVKTQNTVLGGNFGQEVCLSGVPTQSYFLTSSQKPSEWNWFFHRCVAPKEPNNLLRLFYCVGLLNGKS